LRNACAPNEHGPAGAGVSSILDFQRLASMAPDRLFQDWRPPVLKTLDRALPAHPDVGLSSIKLRRES
jgi:hypothetical protein